jgi:hypothetical protein
MVRTGITLSFLDVNGQYSNFNIWGFRGEEIHQVFHGLLALSVMDKMPALL